MRAAARCPSTGFSARCCSAWAACQTRRLTAPPAAADKRAAATRTTPPQHGLSGAAAARPGSASGSQTLQRCHHRCWTRPPAPAVLPPTAWALQRPAALPAARRSAPPPLAPAALALLPRRAAALSRCCWCCWQQPRHAGSLRPGGVCASRRRHPGAQRQPQAAAPQHQPAAPTQCTGRRCCPSQTLWCQRPLANRTASSRQRSWRVAWRRTRQRGDAKVRNMPRRVCRGSI